MDGGVHILPDAAEGAAFLLARSTESRIPESPSLKLGVSEETARRGFELKQKFTPSY